MDDGYDSSRANDAKYVAQMFEEMRDVLRTINEGVTAIRGIVSNQPTRAEFDELKQDVKVIKEAVKATNRDAA
jgi:hypothetical protein